MKEELLHNMKNIPFNERESFNNAILLLSMVKREYYYIVGFSRPDNKIEVGFDFEDKTLGEVSETVLMQFSEAPDSIKVTSELSNMFFEGENEIPIIHNGCFTVGKGRVCYERLFEKDSLIPVNMDRLNTMILSVKKDITDFEKNGAEYMLSKNRKR